MVSPFQGERHRSWLSDTVIFAAAFVVVLGITALSDYLNGPGDPPAYLVGLCGATGSALFGAVSSDRNKREREIVADAVVAKQVAVDTNSKMDDLVKFTTRLNQLDTDEIPESLLPHVQPDSPDTSHGES